MFVSLLAQFILKNRLILFFIFLGFTVFCGISLKNINTNPGFEKTLPIEHPYIKTFFDYREIFGNANRVIISYKPATGTIYNAESLDVLKSIFKSSVQSLTQRKFSSRWPGGTPFAGVYYR